MTLRTLSLFSGIGGFDLGLERTGGFETVAFCEIDPFCRRVLAKHWPEVPCYDDVRELTAARLAADGIAVDVIAGGFPCQDVSVAGKRAGLEGERSGLWGEYRRLIGECRPRWVIIENVPGLVSSNGGRDFHSVLGDLAALRYDAVWDHIPASAVGAPHRRDRVWIVVHAADGIRRPVGRGVAGSEAESGSKTPRGPVCEGMRLASDDGFAAGSSPDAPHAQRHQLRQQPGRRRGARGASAAQLGEHGAEWDVADAVRNGRVTWRQGDAAQEPRGREPCRGGIGAHVRNTNVSGLALPERQSRDVGEELATAFGADWREPESGLGRMADGLSHWLDEPADIPRVAASVKDRVARLKALGNAIVPQIAEMIGRSVLRAIHQAEATP